MDYFDCAWCHRLARGIALHSVTQDWLPSCGEDYHGEQFRVTDNDPNWAHYSLKNIPEQE